MRNPTISKHQAVRIALGFSKPPKAKPAPVTRLLGYPVTPGKCPYCSMRGLVGDTLLHATRTHGDASAARMLDLASEYPGDPGKWGTDARVAPGIERYLQ